MFDEALSSRVLVDLDALRHNYRWFAAQAPGIPAGPVVKADGYGCGLERVARALAAEGAETFFVATIGEGVRLRATLPTPRIVVLGGPWHGDVPRFLEHALTPVLNSPDQLRTWREHAGGAPWWLHVDTGMTRLGVSVDALPDAAFAGMCGWMTHLACADDPDHPANVAQLDRIRAIRTHLPDVPVSIANSAGILLGPAAHGDLLRPGVGLYGVQPRRDGAAPLRPVARFQARIQQIRDVEGSVKVGYGGTHTQVGGTLITVAAGYADGYPRALGNRGWIGWRGQRLPVVGRVSMDSLVADASAAAGAAPQVGDWVDLWGGSVDVTALAAAIDTIAYELLVRVSVRVPRIAIV